MIGVVVVVGMGVVVVVVVVVVVFVVVNVIVLDMVVVEEEEVVDGVVVDAEEVKKNIKPDIPFQYFVSNILTFFSLNIYLDIELFFSFYFHKQMLHVRYLTQMISRNMSLNKRE
jgi:hypothetical protein